MNRITHYFTYAVSSSGNPDLDFLHEQIKAVLIEAFPVHVELINWTVSYWPDDDLWVIKCGEHGDGFALSGRTPCEACRRFQMHLDKVRAQLGRLRLNESQHKFS